MADPLATSDTQHESDLVQWLQQRETREMEAFWSRHMTPPAPEVQPSTPHSQVVVREAMRQGLDPRLALAVMQSESNGNALAVSPKGAQGLMQLMPATAAELGVQNALDPAQSAYGGVKYLKQMHERYRGDIPKILAAYNAGPGAVDRYGGIPPFAETQNYVRKTMARMGQSQTFVRPELTDPLQTPEALGDLGQTQHTGQAPSVGQQAIAGAKQAVMGSPVARFGAGVARGVAGAVSGLALAPLALGAADEGAPAGQTLRKLATPFLATADFLQPENPGLMDQVAQAIGSQVAFLVPSMGIAKGVQLVAGASKLAGMTAAASNAVLEAGVEASESYEQMRTLVGDEEAQSRAQMVFGKNAALIALTDSLGIFNDALKPLVRGFTAALMEGAQERIQYNIGNAEFWVPANHPAADQLKQAGWQEQEDRLALPWSAKDAWTAQAIGTLLGGGAGATMGMMQQADTPLLAQLQDAVLGQHPEAQGATRQQRWFQLLANERGAVGRPSGPGAGEGTVYTPEQLARLQAQQEAAAQSAEAGTERVTIDIVNQEAPAAPTDPMARPIGEFTPEELAMISSGPEAAPAAPAEQPVVLLSEAQQRMTERAESPTGFLEGDRVQFRLPENPGQTLTGTVTGTTDADVTVQYGRRQQQATIPVPQSPRGLRLQQTRAQQQAEAQSSLVDLAQITREQIEDIITTPDHPVSGRITGINWDRIQTPAQVKQMLADLMTQLSTHVQTVRGPTMTHERIVAEAQRHLAEGTVSVDSLLTWEPGTPLDAPRIMASRMLAVSIGEELNRRVQAYTADPSPINEQRVFQFFPLAGTAISNMSGIAATTGRALNAFIPDATGEVQYLQDVGDRIQAIPLGVSKEEFLAHLSTLKTPAEIATALKHIPTWGEMFLAGMYGMKLMRITTDVKNILGNAATFLWTAGVREAAARLPFTSGEVAKGEGVAMIYGWWRANQMLFGLWKELEQVPVWSRFGAMTTAAAEQIGFDDMFERLKTEGLSGEQVISSANLRARATQSNVLGRSVGSLLAGGPKRSALVDFIGAILHSSSAKLNFEDTIFKTYNFLAEGYAYGYREGMNQGLTGADLENFMQRAALNMEGPIKDKAKALAFENTLTEDLGPMAAYINNAIDVHPAVRSFIMFFRTPMNAARFAVRNSPLGLLAQRNQEMLKAGGRDADIAATRMALGSTFMGLATIAGLMGLVSGKSPDDRESRRLMIEDAKVPEYAIYIPGVNRWVSYDWLDPVSMVFGMGADVSTMLKRGAFRDLDWWESVAMGFAAGALAIGNNVMSRTWMTGARQLLDTFVPKPGTDPDTLTNPFKRVALDQLRGAIPPPLKYARSLTDPVIREVHGFYDTLLDNMPFMSGTLPPAHNKLGYIRMSKDSLGPDYVSPVYVSEEANNQVFAEMGRLITQGYLSVPDTPRWLQAPNGRIELSGEERSHLELLIAGGNPSVTGQPGRLETTIKNLMQSDKYQNVLSDMGRGVAVREKILEAHKSARDKLLRDIPSLRDEYMQGKREYKQQLRQGQRPGVGQ